MPLSQAKNTTERASARFWRFVAKTDECWEWTGATNADGYGKFKFFGIVTLAHRVSWELHAGETPGAMFVCHRCDNPRCVRPDHLFLGDCVANSHDAMRKGRLGRRLALDTVKSIIEKLNAGVSIRHIAREYRVAAKAIRKIRDGTAWASVPRKAA